MMDVRIVEWEAIDSLQLAMSGCQVDAPDAAAALMLMLPLGERLLSHKMEAALKQLILEARQICHPFHLPPFTFPYPGCHKRF